MGFGGAQGSGGGGGLTSPVGVADGGTGASTAAAGLSALGGINIANVPFAINQWGYVSPRDSTTTIGTYGIYQGVSLADDSSNRINPGAAHPNLAFGQTCAATTGSNAGWLCDNSAQHVTSLESEATLIYCWSIDSYADIRFYCGVADITTVNAGVSADTFGQEAYGIQFSTGRGDTNFQAISSDNTTQTTTDMGGAPAINTVYIGVVDVQSGGTQVDMTVYTASTGAKLGSTTSITTNLPVNTVGLSSVMALQCLNNNAIQLRTFYGWIVNKALRISI